MLAQLLLDFQTRARRLSVAVEAAGAAEMDGEQAQVLRRDRLETAFRLRVLRVEREVLARMSRQSEINDQTERLLARELDHQEEVLSAVARSLPSQTGTDAEQAA